MLLLRLIPFRLLLVLIAGLALALCGQGAGWWGDASQGEASQGEGGATTTVTEATHPESPLPRAAAPDAQAEEAKARAAAAAAEAAEKARAEADAAAKARAAAQAAAEADRAGAIAALDADLAARVGIVAAHVRRGAFHAACDAIAELDPQSRPAVAEALRAVALAAGWPELHGVVRDPAPVEATTLSLQGRLVRAAKDAAASRVLSQDRTDATLRIAGPAGVTFPKFPIHRLEPDSVRADEAAELGYAAYAQADYAAARVWCAVAIAKSREISARAEQLKALLR